jgi:DNA-binding IclR family transcriptional regulator
VTGASIAAGIITLQICQTCLTPCIEGVAFDREEHTLGICAVGKTVRDLMGNPVAITISVPSTRFYSNEQKLSAALVQVCEEIQRRFDALV